MTATEERTVLEADIKQIKSWVYEVSKWFKKVNSEIEKIDSILNTYNESSKNIDSINFFDTWINKILVLYYCITNDISQIQNFLIIIIHDKIEYINECNEIIKNSVMFFNILLPIINKIKNIVTNNTDKKRKLDKDYEKSNELLEEEKVKDNTFSTNITDVNTIRNNKMQDKLDTGIDLILKASQVKD